jgi:O-antigen/teichoic acid export membrane protein
LPVLTYIAFNIDILVAGKLISVDLVGMYGMALVLARAPQDLFGRIISPILLPAFAEKQDDRKALCRAILRITKVIMLFAVPLVILAIIYGRNILSLVYGAQYSAVAAPFGLLCIYVLLIIQGMILGSVFFGLGQPEKHRLFVGSSAIILIILIYPAIKIFGLTGAASALLLANFIALCLQVIVIHKTIGLRFYDYAISWLPGLAMAVPVLVIVELSRFLKPDLPVLYLAAGALSFVVICLAGVFLLNHNNIFDSRKSGNSGS